MVVLRLCRIARVGQADSFSGGRHVPATQMRVGSDRRLGRNCAQVVSKQPSNCRITAMVDNKVD